eukprot:96422_1
MADLDAVKYLSYPELKLLYKIFTNIINNPENEKYGNLNCKRILAKLEHKTVSIQLLLNSGFKQSDDDTRLIFTRSALELLKITHLKIQKLLSSFTQNNVPLQQLKRQSSVSTDYNKKKTAPHLLNKSQMIDLIKTCQVLNVEEKESTLSVTDFAFKQISSDKSYIISDAAKHLLIIIQFKEIINLQYIKICPIVTQTKITSMQFGNRISGPKEIHLYANIDSSIDVESLNSKEPNRYFICSPNVLKHGQDISVKTSITFHNIKSLAIHIKTNQKGTDQTCVGNIEFVGIQKKKQETDNKFSNIISITCSKEEENDIDRCIKQLQLGLHHIPKINKLLKYCKCLLDPNTNRCSRLKRDITKKIFLQCPGAMDLLVIAGYYQSNNGKLLIYDRKHTYKLSFIQKRLQNILATCQTIMSGIDCKSQHKCDILDEKCTDNEIEIDFFQKLSKTENRFNSKHLLYSRNSVEQETNCKIDDCPCLKMIENILHKYHCYIKYKQKIQQHIGIEEHDFCIQELIAAGFTREYAKSAVNLSLIETNNTQLISHMNKKIEDCILAEIGDGYKTIDLLNDFHHIMSVHSCDFEEIYEKFIINEQCSTTQCLMLKRNQRDRSLETKNETLLTRLYFNENDILLQQLLDSIHCHYFHSFDIGYRL